MSVYILFQAAGTGTQGIMSMLPMMGILFLIFWFLILRPQKKEQDRHAQFIGSLKSGDEVVTDSGLVGTIRRVEERFVVLEIDKRVKVRVLRSKIQASASELLEPPIEVVDAEPTEPKE